VGEKMSVSVSRKIIEFNEVIKKMNEDPKVSQALAGVDKEFQYNFTDLPEANYYLKLKDGKVTLIPGKAPHGSATMVLSTKDWDEIIHGRLNSMVAMTQKKLKLEGDAPSMMKLMPIFPTMIKIAKELG
jgi:putative sterol carrier protein